MPGQWINYRIGITAQLMAYPGFPLTFGGAAMTAGDCLAQTLKRLLCLPQDVPQTLPELAPEQYAAQQYSCLARHQET